MNAVVHAKSKLKPTGFFLARNANARRRLTWELEKKTQWKAAGVTQQRADLIFRQYIGETKHTQSMKVLKNASTEKSRRCFDTPVDTVS